MTRQVAGPPRVVHVITSLTTGGAERQLESLARLTRTRTTTVALYSGGPVAESMRHDGQRVEVLDLAGWRRAWALVVLVGRLRRLRPDIVHVHLLSAQLWGIPAARLAGVPVVVSTEHSLMADTIEGRPHTRWLKALYRVLERMATRTVAVSATTAERLVDWGVPRSRITVSDNGIDFERLAFDPGDRARVRAELGIADDTLVLGAVGRLDPVKRMDTVIRACAPLLRDGAVLVVAGTGPLHDDLVRLVDELGVHDRVRLLGARGDVPAVLGAMDVLVSASADETFGMAVVEGLASGLPVVYVEAPALEELARHPVHAIRVEPTQGSGVDPDHLRAAITEAVAALGGAGTRWTPPADLVERYGAAAAAERVDALYDDLLERARA